MTKPEIMVVEDEWIIANDIKASLGALGYSVSSLVTSGEEAVSAAGQEKPDLVLMDIVLQGKMDGIEAAEIITSRLDIPVIYLTSYADEKVLKQARKSGAYGYLMKPFRDAEMKAAIEMALNKHRMEIKLKESEKKLFITLKSISDGVISTDENGSIKFMNPLAETLTGCSFEEAENKNLPEVFNIRYGEVPVGADNVAKKLIQRKMTVTQMNYTLRTRNGSDIIVELSAAPITDNGGGVGGMVIVFNDITKRVRMEEELHKYRSHLEEMVRERTAQLIKTNEQLQQEIAERKKVEEKIKASLKEKEVLLSEIHHRVGNNLQVIYGMLNIQKDYVKDKQSIDVFRGCQNRIMTMSLVHKTLYKSEDLANIDVNDYIHKLVSRLYQSYGISAEKILLKINVGHVPMGINNAITCGLIINEIVSNSLRHAFPDGREGEIQISLFPRDDKIYELIIRDNGIGIPEGLDIRSAPSLGFKTIVSYENVGNWGKFGLNRENGTEFRIKFKAE